MNFLITGGSGLIGKAISEALILQNHKVTIVSRNPNKMKDIFDNISVIGWEKDILVENLEEIDVVINLAGESIAGANPLKMRWTTARKKRILESRVSAGEKITNAIKATKNKPKLIVQSSAVGIYGPQGEELIEEHHPPGIDFLSNVCQQWEDSTLSVESLGVRRIIIRTGLVLSSKGGIFPLLKLPYSMFVGGVLGSGSQYMPWIHIEDLVNSIIFLIENKFASGVINLVSPNPVNNKQFGNILAKIMVRPSFLSVPTFLLKFLLGEASTLVLDGQRVYPAALMKLKFNFQYEKLEKTLDSLLNKNMGN
jgi:uncharacterized protein